MTHYLLLLLLIGGCGDWNDFERDDYSEELRRADTSAFLFKEQAGGKWTPAAVRSLSASLIRGNFIPQQALAELGILTGRTSYKVEHIRMLLEGVAQRMEQDAPVEEDSVKIEVTYKLEGLEWTTILPGNIKMSAPPHIANGETTYAQYVRLVPASLPAPADTPDVIHFKAVGLDTLQYALQLLDRWSQAFDDRRYVGGPGNLKAKTDSLLNNPVIRERRVIR